MVVLRMMCGTVIPFTNSELDISIADMMEKAIVASRGMLYPCPFFKN